MLATITVQEWHVMEDLAEYKLTFVEPVEQTNLYELAVRPVLVDQVRQLQQQDQIAEIAQARLIHGKHVAG